MQSLWRDGEAAGFGSDGLGVRVYTSRLLGKEPALVLHGGGNTSVKTEAVNLFGETEEVICIKGSGRDLASIDTAGFAPVKLALLKRMAELDCLSDAEMVRAQRAAMTDPAAPTPSVEAVLHALIPFKYVDHTHADAVITITNTEAGEERIRRIYGDRVLIVPYVMPGFVLAKKVHEMTRQTDWTKLSGIILMNHGVFTFADDAKTSYERMIFLVSEAESFLASDEKTFAAQNVTSVPDKMKEAELSFLASDEKTFAAQNVASVPDKMKEAGLTIAQIRKQVSRFRGHAVIAITDGGREALDFSNLPDVKAIATRGPLTPNHVIRTKSIPVIIEENPQESIADYAKAYLEYFERHAEPHHNCMNPAPCWAIWPGIGTISFGASVKDAEIVAEIKNHTIRAIRSAERLGGWKALPEDKVFEVEYWELEQAKYKKTGPAPVLQGKIALVSGAASGIGQACVEQLCAQGAAVAALDLNPAVTTLFDKKEIAGIVCDVTRKESIRDAVEAVIQRFGGLDILISNAGTFPSSAKIAEMDPDTWDRSMAVNLTSHQRVLQACTPYLALGIDPAVVMIASKNVPAPGPGASAYSVAKAGQTQLARVAALELGPSGIRVNIIHPNAVFDTGIWTREVLEKRAKHYGMTVEAYKTNNVLRTEVTSKDVATLVCTMAGPVFAKTTGAQVPIDGGNERVI